MPYPHHYISFYKAFLLLLPFLGTIIQGSPLQFSFPPLEKEELEKYYFLGYPSFSELALHISCDSKYLPFPNRVIYQKPFKLSKRRIGWPVHAFFNTTFVFNFPKESSQGHAFAFLLSSHPMVLNKDEFLLQFTTTENNSLKVTIKDSTTQVPQPLMLILNLSIGLDVHANVIYDGNSKSLSVHVSTHNGTKIYNASSPHDLSKVLLRQAFVGFSSSSGNENIKSWTFSTKDAERRKWARPICIKTAIVAIVLFFLVILVLWIIRSRHSRRPSCLDIESVLADSTIGPHRFQLKQLKAATKNFDPTHKLGQGGFGTVYKGSLNKVAVDIAVKRASKDSLQRRQELLAEVTTFNSIRHKNIVKLLGWCNEEDELLLVYELLPKGSLDKLIFSKDDMVLSWERRHGIITGVASALCYLHDGCEMKVLHRDVKAGNVMIDSDCNARLGDFGLARTMQRNGETHYSSNAVAGTPGYIAPEYYFTGRASVETDVYGFGILVLEVACGRRPGDLDDCSTGSSCSSCCIYNTVDWVWKLYGMGRVLEAVDCRLHGEYDVEQMERVLRLGLACCHPNPHERPPMRVAVQVLRGEVDAPSPVCEKPSFLWPVSSTFSSVSDSFSSDDSVSP
ncbi:hypothetical protein AAC387_Pa11g2056 [Persea americana]